MTQKAPAVPVLDFDQGLNRYLAEIKRFPILTPEQEFMLANRFCEHGDTDAAAQLVTSHLRLVAKVAMRVGTACRCRTLSPRATSV